MPIGFSRSDLTDQKFNIDTQYLYLDCPVHETKVSVTDQPKSQFNATGTGSAIVFSENVWDRPTKQLSDLTALKPVNLTYYTMLGGVGLLRCSVTTTYIEAEVACPTSSTCAVERLRRSRLDHPPPAYTTLDKQELGRSGGNNWDLFNKYFLTSWRSLPTVPTVLDNYLISPNTPSIGVKRAIIPAGDSTVYAARLGQLFNAYWQSMQLYQNITGVEPEWAKAVTPGGTDLQDAYFNSNFTFYNTSRHWLINGTGNIRTEVIVAHKGWVATLCIASIVLFLVSLIPPVFRLLCHGPPLEINLSDLLTRHNPYIPLSATGTSVEAAERTRLLRNIRVRYGDVEPRAEIGVLAVGMPVPGLRDIGKVRKGRLYE
jgi:hypothetical protein